MKTLSLLAIKLTTSSKIPAVRVLKKYPDSSRLSERIRMALSASRCIFSARCKRVVCRRLELIGHVARPFTPAIFSKPFPASSLVLLLATVLGLLLLSRPLLAQVDPNVWFFELDGDYREWLEDTKGGDGDSYLPAEDVNLPDGSRSWGRRQMPCANWASTMNAPYMGSRSYRV